MEKYYKNKKPFKEIRSFNNKLFLGAATYSCRSQGAIYLGR